MNSEGLYHLIHSLSSAEKAAFRKWTKAMQPSRSKDPKYLVLYERMNGVKKFDDAKIRGKEFADSKYYNRVREILLEKIVFCMAGNDKNTSMISVVETAVQFGATNIAARYIESEAQKAMDSENWAYLYQLLDLSEEYFRDYRIRLYEETEHVSRKLCMEKLSRISGLKSLHSSCLELFGKSEFEKEKIGKVIRERLSHFQPTSDQELYWKLSLEIAWLEVSEQRKEALGKMSELANIAYSDRLQLRTPQKAKALNLGVISATTRKERSESIKFLFRLSEISNANHYLRRLVDRFKITRTIEVGHVFFDLELLKQGQQMLESQSEVMVPWEAVKYWYYIALSYLYCGKFRDGLKALHRLRQYNSSEWGELNWQPEVLRLVLHYNQYRGSDIDDVLLAAARKVQPQASQYPQLIVRTIRSLISLNDRASVEKVLLSALDVESELIKTATERWQKNFFDFSAWLNAEVQMVNISQLPTPNQAMISLAV